MANGDVHVATAAHELGTGVGTVLAQLAAERLGVPLSDLRRARYVNDNLADYRIPVNADVQQVDVILISEQDHDVNPAGVKGLGELGNVGTNAAIANAVYHATGKRIRKLPIQIEDVLSA